MFRDLSHVLQQRLELIAVAKHARRSVLFGVVATVATNALLPAALALAIARAIGRISDTAALGPDADFEPVIWPILLVGCLILLQSALDLALRPLRQLLVVDISAGTRRRVRQAAVAPVGVGHLEQQDMLDSAALPVSNPFMFDLGGGVEGQIFLVARYVGALAAAAVTASVSLPAAVVVFVAMTAQRSVLRRHYASSLASHMVGASGDMRSAEYWLGMLGPEGAKELRIYDFGELAVDRYERSTEAVNAAYIDVCRSAYPLHLRIAAAVSVGTLGALVLVATQAVDGGLSAEQLAAALGGIVAVTTSLGSMGSEAYVIEAAVPILKGLRDLEAVAEGNTTPSTEASEVGEPDRAPTIVFENVHFRYAPTDHDVLKGVDLVLDSGESVAIVGENGEGKTTLLKLLAGLYQPTQGRILIDGVPLQDYDIAAWRRRLAVILQDFVRFELSVFANIAMADLDRADAPELARGAAVEAGCLGLIEGFENGWETILSREYTGGSEISGGEWQRIALARALYAAAAGGQVLVLDEPTASLDAKAEVALFERLMDAAAGLTRIVVSHRFSTVRRADRIVVLADGVVAEDGDHDTLHSTGGIYSRLYDLQAAPFMDEAASDA